MKDKRIRLNTDEITVIYEALKFYHDRKSDHMNTSPTRLSLVGRFKTILEGYYQRGRKN